MLTRKRLAPESCPKRPKRGDPPLVSLPLDRYDDEEQDPEEITRQLEKFTALFQKFEKLSQNYETNFYASHHPVFAVACNDTTMVDLDWTMQQSIGPSTLDRVSAIISGHMHWLSALSFENHQLPDQIVVGHGGTNLIDNPVNQDALVGLQIRAGKNKIHQGTVRAGITTSEMFGFGVLERNDEGDYDVYFKGVDVAQDRTVLNDFTLSIPKGPRVRNEPDWGVSSDTHWDLSSPTFAWKTMVVGVFAFMLGLAILVRTKSIFGYREPYKRSGGIKGDYHRTYGTEERWQEEDRLLERAISMTEQTKPE